MIDQVNHVDLVYETVHRREDIVFRTVTNHAGEREDLRLDVYTPEGDTRTDRRAILWIHGGGFRPGNDKRQSYIVRIATEFARRGYVGVSCDYRVREEPKSDLAGAFRDAAEDGRAALAWLRAHAEEYGVQADRVVVAGGSAGGMTAVTLSALEAVGGPSAGVPSIAALVNLWGSPSPEAYLAAVDGRFPPTITVHGTADQLVPYENSVVLTALLERAGVRHELVTIEGAPHTPVAYMPAFAEAIARFLAEVLSGL
jgi:acetyl esterase/lipase